MEAYRDQYATIFNNGKNVVVLAVSADADTTLAAWAREGSFPFLFVSDADQAIGKAYASTRGARHLRSLFVIGPDGRVTYRVPAFNVLSQQAYADLQQAVTQAMGAGAGGSGAP